MEVFVEIPRTSAARTVHRAVDVVAGERPSDGVLIMIDALRRASAGASRRDPYYGYARQDRKVAPRTPISAKLSPT